jgi:hypothetical protein
MPDPSPIALIDARRDPLAAATPERIATLMATMFTGQPRRLVDAALVALDPLWRSWLSRTPSPYREELASLAKRIGMAGVYAINFSYEYGCTSFAGPGDRVPLLRRVLDWPFLGLGRQVIVLHRQGPAGDVFDVTWPGAIGSLTAMAPGRFALSLNQAPMRRRTGPHWLRGADYALNGLRTLVKERGLPALHLLRQTAETAADFGAALQQLRDTPIARPALYLLTGTGRDEIALIERTETDARVFLGPTALANDWREPQADWEPRACAGLQPRADNLARLTRISETAALSTSPFDWVLPPVRNWNTRVCVEMAADGTLRVIGCEPVPGTADVMPATALFDLARERNA